MKRPACGLAPMLMLMGIAVGAMTTPASAADAEGQIVDFEILPPEITVQVGDSITWTNNGARPHTITDRGGMFDTDAILPGAQATVTVTVPGAYEIFCQINPSRMNARLVVEPGPTASSEVRVQAFDEAREGEAKRFDPPELEIAAGSRLILANVGGLRHSLKAENGSFAIPVVDPGAENGRFAGTNGAAVVEAPGTHAFFCEIHPAAMKGTLVVTATSLPVDAEERAPPEPERPPATATADVAEFAFDPVETLVASGGEVTWANGGSAAHTATFDDIELDTGRIEPGASASLTAPGRPGSYSYFCSIHTRMRGVVIVSPEAANPEATAAAAPSPAGAPARNEDDAAGTVFAWLVAVLVVGVGVVGLFFGLRRAVR